MTDYISNALLSRISQIVAQGMGLHFPAGRWSDLRRGIRSAVPEFGFEDPESCLRWLLSSPLSKNHVEILASHLTNGETYFFREKPVFEALSEDILPELIRVREKTSRQLRIWSAGCSTGEEPYSIAILLSRLIPDIENWNITVLATDINPRALRRASLGLYKKWSFRGTPAAIRKQYFRKRCFNRTKEGLWRIRPGIRRMVKLAYLNLAEDSFPSLLNNTNAMDLILCRNVLMYFEERKQKRVAENFSHALLDGGWLIAGASESSQLLFTQFQTVNFPGATFYRKDLTTTDKTSSIPSPTFSIPSPTFTFPLQGVSKEKRNGSDSIRVESDTFTDQRRDDRKERRDDRQERIKETPEPDQPSYEEAYALYEQGSYAQAMGRLSRPAQDEPEATAQDEPEATAQDEPMAIALLARIYANQGQLAEALEVCEKAVAADRLNPVFHFLQAIILLEQGEIEGTIGSLKRALYLDPDFVLANFMLGSLCVQRGNFGESKRHFRNTLKILKDHDPVEVLPESDGVTAGRLTEIISTMSGMEP